MEKKQPELTEDLPREIVQLILSFLSMKEAVRTCLLSSTWSSIWKPLVVDLEASGDNRRTAEAVIQAISTFLDNQDAPQKLKFSIRGEIIGAAVTKGYDNDLHIDFSGGCESPAEFIFEFRQDFPAPEISTDSFLSLKTLHLRSISSRLTENFVSSLLPSCCSLESLKLEKCGGLRRIDVVLTGGCSLLRVLEFCDCSDVDSMIIFAPDLTTLYYSGVLPTTIQLQGTSQLIDVKFEFGYGVGLCQEEFDCEQLILFLSSLKEIQLLTISGWIIEWMCSGGVIFGRLDFRLSKLKKLRCTYSSMDSRKRDSLACFLNIAPVLETLFINVDQQCRNMEAPIFHQFWHEPHLWEDCTAVKSESSHLVNLKVIKIIGFSKHEDPRNGQRDRELLLLMDRLAHTALNLKEMTVVTTSVDQN